MKLLCLAPYVYQEQRFVAGEVYDLANDVAVRFLRDYGPMAEDDTRGLHEVRFVVAPAAVEEAPVEVAPETEPTADATPEPETPKPAPRARAPRKAAATKTPRRVKEGANSSGA